MSTDIAAEYYSHLDRFIELCDKLITEQKPYMAVLLCHELYRFLYPTEPYIGFTHTEPVNFITEHIRKLIALGETADLNIAGYSGAFAGEGTAERTFEQETSDLYVSLWQRMPEDALAGEGTELLTRRIPQSIIDEHIRGKHCLDMGNGSGRFSLALMRAGAARVTGVDIDPAASRHIQEIAAKESLALSFVGGNFLSLPFPDNSFEFVFSNGTLHHSRSVAQSLDELARVLKPGCASFLYLYAAGGIFWKTREVMRPLFKRIPLRYTQNVLQLIGMPQNRFIFCDVWYVPKEDYTTRNELEGMLSERGFTFEKLISKVPYDLDRALTLYPEQGEAMWGDGEHRYLLQN